MSIIEIMLFTNSQCSLTPTHAPRSFPLTFAPQAEGCLACPTGKLRFARLTVRVDATVSRPHAFWTVMCVIALARDLAP